jgi:ribosomal protein L37E
MCGSKTVVKGVCITCGFKPNLKRERFSKKEWAQLKKDSKI